MNDPDPCVVCDELVFDGFRLVSFSIHKRCYARRQWEEIFDLRDPPTSVNDREGSA